MTASTSDLAAAWYILHRLQFQIRDDKAWRTIRHAMMYLGDRMRQDYV